MSEKTLLTKELIGYAIYCTDQDLHPPPTWEKWRSNPIRVQYWTEKARRMIETLRNQHVDIREYVDSKSQV